MQTTTRHNHLALSRYWAYIAFALATLGIGAGLWGQRLVDRRQSLAAAGLLYGIAALSYALSTARHPRERRRVEAGSFPGVHLLYLRWAVVFGVLAFFSFRDNRFGPQGLLTWGLGIVLCFVAVPRHKSSDEPGLGPRLARIFRQRRLSLSWDSLALLLAIAVGAFFRFYRLLELPADLGWDLPYNYTDAQRILHGEYPVFFPDNYGREGMFFYLIVAVSKIIGLSPYSIRLTSALVGVATLPAIYLLARELADRRTAVLATWLLALNKWHIVLTRSGYRVSLMPLFSILLLYGLARGLRRGGPRDWAWAGCFLGLGLWTYKSFVFALPLAIGALGLYALMARLSTRCVDRRLLWPPSTGSIIKGLGLMLLVALIVYVPMLRFLADTPELYLARELQGTHLVGESLERAGITPLQLYARNTLTSLLMFNYEGDGNSRFGMPFQRHMGYVSGVLFVLGFVGAMARWRRGGNLLLVLATLGFLAPMTISMLAGEKPNCFRSSGVIGPTLVLAAVVLRGLMSHLTYAINQVDDALRRSTASGVSPKRRPILAGLLALALVSAMLGKEADESYRFYFHDFRQQAPDGANYSVALAMANTIIAFEDGPAYVRAWPHWYDGRALNVHLSAAGRSHNGELHGITPDKPPLLNHRGKLLIILPPDDTADLEVLKTRFQRWFVKGEYYPSGAPSLVAFYGDGG